MRPLISLVWILGKHPNQILSRALSLLSVLPHYLSISSHRVLSRKHLIIFSVISLQDTKARWIWYTGIISKRWSSRSLRLLPRELASLSPLSQLRNYEAHVILTNLSPVRSLDTLNVICITPTNFLFVGSCLAF